MDVILESADGLASSQPATATDETLFNEDFLFDGDSMFNGDNLFGGETFSSGNGEEIAVEALESPTDSKDENCKHCQYVYK